MQESEFHKHVGAEKICLSQAEAPGTRDTGRHRRLRRRRTMGGSHVTTATKVAIKPLEDRIVVQANEAETTTASGIVIAKT